MEAFLRTEANRHTRILIVELGDGRTAKLYGDPAKAVAFLLIFNNSTVKSWVRGKGLKFETAEEVCEAIEALSRNPLTWREAAERGFLQNPAPQRVLRALALDAILKK